MKTLTFDDLSRAELLKLIRRKLPLLSCADLLWAQWEAATEETERLFDATCTASRQHIAAMERYHKSTVGTGAEAKLMRAYASAKEAEGAAQRRFEAAERRQKRLYEAWKAEWEATHA